jgi:hypothetical protein
MQLGALHQADSVEQARMAAAQMPCCLFATVQKSDEVADRVGGQQALRRSAAARQASLLEA